MWPRHNTSTASASRSRNDNSAHTSVPRNGTTRSQRRAGRWRATQAFDTMQSKIRKFTTGTESFYAKAKPTNAELLEFVRKEFRPKRKTEQLSVSLQNRAQEIASAERAELKVVHDLLDDWQRGGHGMVPETKPGDTIRFLFENWNSLQAFTSRRKINMIESLRKRYNADMIAGVEAQANWYFASEEQSFHELFGVGETRKSVTGYNIHEPFGKNQQGGTAAMAFGRLANFVMDKGNDSTGLG